MKITKRAFVEAMTSNQSTFMGIARRLLEKDELFCTIEHFFDPAVILEKRECKAHSTFLEFTGGSRLGFDQVGKYEFHMYEYANGTAYICVHMSYDEFDEKWYTKAMYYLI